MSDESTTSETTVSFNIPSGTKVITIEFNDEQPFILLMDKGGVESSGYLQEQTSPIRDKETGEEV